MESRQHRFCAACCLARRSSASRRSAKSSVGPFSQTPPSIWSYPSTRDSRSWQRRSTHCCPPPTLFESAGWRGGKATKRKIANLVINAASSTGKVKYWEPSYRLRDLSSTWSGHPRLGESHRTGKRRKFYATEVRMFVLGRICIFAGDRGDSCWCGHSAEFQLGSLFVERHAYC